MQTNIDDNCLNIILNEGEGYLVEFKETLSKIDKEIVAFANSSGGRIFLGISDDAKIKGFSLNNKIKSEIQSIAENCDPPIRINIEQYENITIINIPEGNRKPYKCAAGFYIRNGATSQKMVTDDIISFIQNEGRLLFDEIVDSKVNFYDVFDKNKYNNFIIKCGISSEYAPENILNNLGVTKIDNGVIFLNNTGILFFSNNPTLIFPQAVITCVLYKGNDKIYILDRKDFNADLISNIEDTIIFLKKHLNLRYIIETLQRHNVLEIPEEALREAIVNSVVHRDYFEKGANILVEIFDNRIEISNPGGLVKGLKESELGTKSITRNPLIASLMLRANYIEKLGTGIKRIQNALKDAGLKAAVFEIGYFFTIKIFRNVDYQHTSIDESSPSSSPNSSPSNLQLIVEMMKINPKVTITEISNQIGITDRAIKKNIAKLKEKNIIRRIGSNFTGHWEVISNTEQIYELL